MLEVDVYCLYTCYVYIYIYICIYICIYIYLCMYTFESRFGQLLHVLFFWSPLGVGPSTFTMVHMLVYMYDTTIYIHMCEIINIYIHVNIPRTQGCFNHPTPTGWILVSIFGISHWTQQENKSQNLLNDRQRSVEVGFSRNTVTVNNGDGTWRWWVAKGKLGLQTILDSVPCHFVWRNSVSRSMFSFGLRTFPIRLFSIQPLNIAHRLMRPYDPCETAAVTSCSFNSNLPGSFVWGKPGNLGIIWPSRSAKHSHDAFNTEMNYRLNQSQRIVKTEVAEWIVWFILPVCNRNGSDFHDGNKNLTRR